jgi:hypothetical protein
MKGPMPRHWLALRAGQQPPQGAWGMEPRVAFLSSSTFGDPRRHHSWQRS